jgi:hypothetical protein
VRIRSGKIELPNSSPLFVALVKAMVEPNPGERLSVDRLLDHQLLRHEQEDYSSASVRHDCPAVSDGSSDSASSSSSTGGVLSSLPLGGGTRAARRKRRELFGGMDSLMDTAADDDDDNDDEEEDQRHRNHVRAHAHAHAHTDGVGRSRELRMLRRSSRRSTGPISAPSAQSASSSCSESEGFSDGDDKHTRWSSGDAVTTTATGAVASSTSSTGTGQSATRSASDHGPSTTVTTRSSASGRGSTSAAVAHARSPRLSRGGAGLRGVSDDGGVSPVKRIRKQRVRQTSQQKRSLSYQLKQIQEAIVHQDMDRLNAHLTRFSTRRSDSSWPTQQPPPLSRRARPRRSHTSHIPI